MPVAVNLDSRLAISMDRIAIFSSIGKLVPPLRLDLPEADMAMPLDAVKHVNQDVVGDTVFSGI